MAETRKLAAILVADVVGYSRLAGADEERTLARLRGLRIDPAIAAHHGRIVKRTGDGSIVEFRSVVDAVRCAIEVQTGSPSKGPCGVGHVRALQPFSQALPGCPAATGLDPFDEPPPPGLSALCLGVGYPLPVHFQTPKRYPSASVWLSGLRKP